MEAEGEWQGSKESRGRGEGRGQRVEGRAGAKVPRQEWVPCVGNSRRA